MSTTTTSTDPGTIDNVPHTADKAKKKVNIGRILAWALLVLALIVTLFPFYWMLRTAFSTSKSLFSNPTSLLPVDPTLGAFKRVLGLSTTAEAQAEGGSGASVNFLLYLRNSILYSTIVTVGQVFFCSLAAYAFSRLSWPGRDKVFVLFLAALMVPPIFTSLPNFILIKNLGLLNSIPGLVLPSLLMTPFAIFFLRQFFLGINKEIEEAASIDGASVLDVLLPDHPADERRADHHARGAELHRRLERLLLAVAGRQHRRQQGAHRRPRRVPQPEPPGQPGLGRPDGRRTRRRPSPADPVRHLRQEGRQLHRLLRHEVTTHPT